MKKISAKCNSDDWVVECAFDATSFFKRAKGENIIALAECGWGGDYPADEVAIHAAGYNESVKDMFKYIELYNKGHKEHVGFECHVDKTQALAWLSKNKPRIYNKIKNL